jgi:hypothetical protein
MSLHQIFDFSGPVTWEQLGYLAGLLVLGFVVLVILSRTFGPYRGC